MRFRQESGSLWTMIHGDACDVLPSIHPDVGLLSQVHFVTDPPYRGHVHQNVRSSKKAIAEETKHLPKYNRSVPTPSTIELGFAAIDDQTIGFVTKQIVRLAGRWVLVFCDAESSLAAWQKSLVVDLEYVRTGAWVRNAAPQFTGDRPAAGFEAIAIAHAKRAKKRWNGGGKAGVWSVPNVKGNVRIEPRVHPAQKPEALMLKLIEDFTDVFELVIDPFSGSGTTGVAAIRLGRRFIGIERDPSFFELSVERLRAEEHGHDLVSERKGQKTLF